LQILRYGKKDTKADALPISSRPRKGAKGKSTQRKAEKLKDGQDGKDKDDSVF